MALVHADRVKETSTTTGTGSYSLAGTVAGFRTFASGIGSGNTCAYVATDGTNWETGIGTVTSGSPDTLARTTIAASSNAGAAVNWGAGTKTLICGPIALILSSLVGTEYWMKQSAGRTLTSSTALQKLFDKTTNGALTIPTGVYRFESFLYLTGMSATTGNALFDILGAGTATLANIGFSVTGVDNTTPTSAASQTGSSAITKATPASMVTGGTGTGMVAFAAGSFEVTAAGTLIPSIQLVTAAAATLNAASYFFCRKIGETGATYAGPWS